MTRAHLAALVAVALLGLALRASDIASAPPGLFYDEAANAIDALDLASDGRPRIFFPGNQGREPLHIYAIALASWAVGPGWLAVRLPAIAVGTATLLAAYALGREIGGRRVGLAAALLLAVSYWHISLSRMGFRAVWVPLVAGLALALTLRAQRTGQRWPAVLAGAAMGLGCYTYIAARVLPLAVVAGTVPVWARGSRRRPAARLALALAVAALVALPIGAYFWRHPELFWGRVETASGGPLSVGDRIVNALGLFVWHGDDLARHNLPGRPVFEPLAGGLFLLGLAICLRRWREPGYAVLPATCAVMLLPQALAWGEPHFLRAAGVLPAAQVTAAIGLEAVTVRLAGRLRRLVLVALALLWAGLVARDYFGTWARSRAAYEAFEGEGRAAVELLRAAPADAPISAGSRLYAERATFYFAEARQPTAVFDGSHALVTPADGRDTIVARPADVPGELRARLGDPVAVAGAWPSEDGQPAAARYRVDPRAFVPTRPLPAVIGGVAAVEGYDLSTSVRPGGQQRFVLAWRVLGPAPPGLFQFAHVLASDGPGRERVLAIEDAAPFPSRDWRGGERALTWFDLRIPLDAPGGALWVETGFYQGGSLRRLAVADPSGAVLGDRLLAGPFKVWDRRGETPRPDRPAATFADGLLLARASAPAAARAGASIPLRLAWWAAGSTATPLTVFVHLLDEADRQRAGSDGPPAGGANPTTIWQPGETVLDDHSLPLPADLPPGRYRIECGLYDAATGRRLTLQSASARLDDGAIVATVDVR